MMKRLAALLLCLVLLAALAACGKKSGTDQNTTPAENGEQTNQTEEGTGPSTDNTDNTGSNNTRIDPETGDVILPWDKPTH